MAQHAVNRFVLSLTRAGGLASEGIACKPSATTAGEPSPLYRKRDVPGEWVTRQSQPQSPSEEAYYTSLAFLQRDWGRVEPNL